MSTVQEIEAAISRLSPEEIATLRKWFIEFDVQSWDRQIEADSEAGRLDKLVDEALGESRSGRATDL